MIDDTNSGGSLAVKQPLILAAESGSTPTPPLQCWQYTIKQIKAQEKSIQLRLLPDMPDKIDLSTAYVRPISYQTAEKVILEYEWLGTMPAITLFCYGIYFDDFLGGVVVYGTEYIENLGVWDKYGYTGKIILLARGACLYWTPVGTASKLIMRSIRLLPEKYEVITATVDRMAGEIGTIYQACGFYYVGCMVDNDSDDRSTYYAWHINGKIYQRRSLRDLIGTERPNVILKLFPDAKPILQYNKERYFYFRGKNKEELKSRIAHLIKPYPKRNALNSSCK